MVLAVAGGLFSHNVKGMLGSVDFCSVVSMVRSVLKSWQRCCLAVFTFELVLFFCHFLGRMSVWRVFAQLLSPSQARKLSVLLARSACRKSVFRSAAITQVEEEP